MGHGVGQAFGDVTLAAVHHLVFSFEREGRQVVVEVVDVARNPPSFFRVAVHTGGAEFTFVGILVAGHTIVWCRADVFLKNGSWREIRRMAGEAIHRFVLPFQWEFGAVMSEAAQCPPVGERLL